MIGDDDYGEILYSSDGSGKNIHQKKNKKKTVEVDPASTTLKLRLEKKGRGGKTVTVIYEVPDNPKYFKRILKELKNHCGVGGSQKPTQLEIQGDQREKVRSYLIGLGFNVIGQ